MCRQVSLAHRRTNVRQILGLGQVISDLYVHARPRQGVISDRLCLALAANDLKCIKASYCPDGLATLIVSGCCSTAGRLMI